MRALLALLSMLVAFAGAARAADNPPPSGHAERVEVRLHLIDVVVTDGDGKPIPGLTPRNFAVTLDGDAREVRTVDRAAASQGLPPQPAAATPAPAPAAPPAAPPATAAAASPPRWVLLVFDGDHLDPLSRADAIGTARKLLETALRPADRVSSVLVRHGTARVIHPFVRADQCDPALFDGTAFLEPTGSSLASRIKTVFEAIGNCTDASDRSTCVYTVASEFLDTTRRENRSSFEALSGLIASLAPLPGRKALLLFADGYVFSPGSVIVTANERITGSAGGSTSRLADQPEWTFETFLGLAARAGVTVFPMRTGTSLTNGLMRAESNLQLRQGVGPNTSRDPYASAAQDVQMGLDRVAETTGGRIVSLSAGPAKEPSLFDRLDAVYTLGVAPAPGDNIRSRLKVKLVGAKGKISAPGHITRAPERTAGIAGALEVTPGGGGTPGSVALALDARTLAVEKDPESGVPLSRFALYWRAIDAAGGLLAEDYQLMALARPSGSPERALVPLPSSACAGAAVLQVFVSDLAGRGTLALTHDFAR